MVCQYIFYKKLTHTSLQFLNLDSQILVHFTFIGYFTDVTNTFIALVSAPCSLATNINHLFKPQNLLRSVIPKQVYLDYVYFKSASILSRCGTALYVFTNLICVFLAAC